MKLHMMFSSVSALVLLAGCPGASSGPTGPQPQLATVTVTCASSSVKQNNSVRCSALATDQNGEPFTVPAYTWMSSDESVAKVDSQGTASATRIGSVIVTARASSDGVTKQGQASLTVTERVPTVHSAHITSDETWRASDNPHVVHGLLEVNGADAPATLTLEAGVEVRFDEDSQLEVKNGALKAQGTQEQPILLVANQSEPTRGFWRGLRFAQSASESLMEYVTLSDCGRAASEETGRCLSLRDNTALVARDLTIRNSGGMGVRLLGDSAFAAGSARLSVTGCRLYPLDVEGNQVGALPTGGTFTGNDKDSIMVNSSVTRSQTWPNLGIPYDFFAPGVGVTGSDSSTPTLTLSAGIVLRFHEWHTFEVVHADLIVNGTEEAPVRFTSSSATPRPGDWRGVKLSGISSNTRLSHTIIEYAGNTLSGDEGNLNLYGSSRCTDCPTLDHVILQKSRVYGMTLQVGGSLGSATTGLTIRDNGSYAIHAQADFVGGLPEGVTMTLSGNSSDAMSVYGSVRHSQTWPNLGFPYDIFGNLRVESDRAEPTRITTLTLSAGTVLRFSPGSSLVVGSQYAGDRAADLIVNGTEEAPVRFTSMSATPRPGDWGGVNLSKNITSNTRLSHALIEYAGSPSSEWGSSNLNMYGSYWCTDCPTLDHVILQKGRGYGMSLNDGSLGSGSTGLTVRDNGNHAIRVAANSVWSLPAGTTLSGNSSDAVEVYSSGVTTTQTWPNLGVPYILTQGIEVSADSYSSPYPTLTLTAGTELRFQKDTGLVAGGSRGGALVVAGTAQAPVRFVPNTSTPSKAFWRGVHVATNATGSRIDHAFISHAGAGGSFFSLQGNLNVYQEYGGFVTNSTFSDGGACGIMVSAPSSGGGGVTTNFTLPMYNNTFLNNTNAPQCAK
ncbi:hypothetical protein D187_009237 [Cystobacter fuscus DSM 2262]|uniref:BIG2 domain-containing protein n=1 Tax=Cystobacter fuscus (strain ATCC 25194 / DSM 2262 / NBRC 100088 / M29) TaxID=1242864 RepID=S9NXQ5_CYSF2|nr:hypothetical protein [Cystobacter fuscus]EPX55626.1 hypothetical protein D187_009237 [Cystobacter fuscus DSM 2262]